MEVCSVPDQGLADMYLIQGAESNPQFTGQLQHTEAMYNVGAPEYYVDQGLYYTAPTGYEYIGTGFEQPNDWEEYHGVFGHDGQDIQYIGAANESLPYMYYASGYGYGQSPFNPYNPLIPGAVMGADGSFIAPQYYTLPSYENSAAPPAYQPMAHQSRSNNVVNGVGDSFSDKGLFGSQVNGQSAKYMSSNGHSSSRGVADNTSTQRNTFSRVADGSRANSGSFKQPVPSNNSGSFTNQAGTQFFNARASQGRENGSTEKVSLGGNQLRTNLSSTTGSSGFNSVDLSQSSINKVKPKTVHGRDDQEGKPVLASEQNREPRTNKSKNQMVVKARTAMAGNADAQGNITISVDEYNNVEFPTDYKCAKFFVIKSYSEDDVHKSVKYNVWSSTPNGNKKLNAAYEGAQRIAAGDPRGCPIFLFFSVNASGQFCGVAEMTGPVDFNKDMDFWQQDKWSGCFPVKWHFVKDLPNSNFRHIILENNENKPVTNSRDTTEVPYKKGLEMLRIFKYFTLKSSLLDDFMYYENRQRLMQEERARLLIKSYENPHLFPLLDPPRKFQPTRDFSSTGDVHGKKHDEDQLMNQNKSNVAQDDKENSSLENLSVPLGNVTAAQNMNNVAQDEKERSAVKNPSELLVKVAANSETGGSSVGEGGNQILTDETENLTDQLKVSSLSIEPETQSDSSIPVTASSMLNSELVGVVTIGSMPVKVKDIGSTFLTVGTIPLDPKALKQK